MNCDRCKKGIVKTKGNGGTGWAKYGHRTVCYACCAELDKEYMQEKGKIDLYLQGVIRPGLGFRPSEVINWPGTLRIKVKEWKKGLHFVPRIGYVPRYDVWFEDESGGHWWGVQRGEWNEIVRCRKVL